MENSFFEEPEFTVIAFSSGDVLCGFSGVEVVVGTTNDEVTEAK